MEKNAELEQLKINYPNMSYIEKLEKLEVEALQLQNNLKLIVN